MLFILISIYFLSIATFFICSLWLLRRLYKSNIELLGRIESFHKVLDFICDNQITQQKYLPIFKQEVDTIHKKLDTIYSRFVEENKLKNQIEQYFAEETAKKNHDKN